MIKLTKSELSTLTNAFAAARCRYRDFLDETPAWSDKQDIMEIVSEIFQLERKLLTNIKTV